MSTLLTQFVNMLGAVLLILAFAMISQRRILSLIHLFTMQGATLSHLGLDDWHAARATYNINHVLDTQYFDGQGDALHDNYWLPTSAFGIPAIFATWKVACDLPKLPCRVYGE